MRIEFTAACFEDLIIISWWVGGLIHCSLGRISTMGIWGCKEQRVSLAR